MVNSNTSTTSIQKLGGKLKMTNAHKSFENQTARERHADFT